MIIAGALIAITIILYICHNQRTQNTNSSAVTNSQTAKTYEDYAIEAEVILTSKLPATERIDSIKKFCNEITSGLKAPMIKMTLEGANRMRNKALNEINAQLLKNNQDTIKTFQSIIRSLDSYGVTGRFIMNIYCNKLIDAASQQ